MSEDYVNFTFSIPENKSVLTPTPGFEINFSHEMPNWWWRFWQFILLGWRWRNLTQRAPDGLPRAAKSDDPEK